MNRCVQLIVLLAVSVAVLATATARGGQSTGPPPDPLPPTVPDPIVGVWQNAATGEGAIVVAPTQEKNGFEGVLTSQGWLVSGCGLDVDKQKPNQVWRITKYHGEYLGGFVCYPSHPAWPASWQLRRSGGEETLIFSAKNLVTGVVTRVRLTHPKLPVQYAFRQHGPEIGSVWNVSGASVNTSTGGDVPLAIKLYGASSTSGSGKLKLEVERPSLEQGSQGGTIVHDDLRPVRGDLELELQVVRASVNSAGWRPDRPSHHARQLVLDVVVTKSNDPNCPRLERGDILLYDEWHPVRTSDGTSTLWPGDEVDMMVCDQRHAHAWEDLAQWDSTHQSYIGVTIKGPWYLWP